MAATGARFMGAMSDGGVEAGVHGKIISTHGCYPPNFGDHVYSESDGCCRPIAEDCPLLDLSLH
jgi:hypothetical protein